MRRFAQPTTQGKGKIERWFKTLRAQLLTRLGAADLHSLEALNRRLAGWIEGEYHHTPHHGLDGETPLERWAQSAEQVRLPEPGLDLDDLFLFEAKRKVNKDRTVSLAGILYEVEAALVGAKVILRYDPLAPAGRAIQVWHEGRQIQLARAVDLAANCFAKRNSSTPAGLKLHQLPGVDEQERG
jgi:hypothetical protein